jgi:hypothetical protein
MGMNAMSRWQARLAASVALALVAGAIGAAFSPTLARAQTSGFPTIKAWALVGAFKDSSDTPRGAILCLGSFGPRPDSLVQQPRTISLRFLRDRVAESRPDFGGYRIYRMINAPDTSGGNCIDPANAVLLRRYSVNSGSELTWNFSRMDSASGQFICHNEVVNDSVVTFVDPDSSGAWVKVCRPGSESTVGGVHCDSIFRLVPPPGPHDGFRTYYSITYEGLNGSDPNFADLYVPDMSTYCDTTGLGRINAGLDPDSTLYRHMVQSGRPNLNNKLRNLVGPVQPTAGPTADLERVRVVPNPYHATAEWEPKGTNELHFTNLPTQATIRIYTVSGDFVRELHHNDTINDFERWDLKSGTGRQVASGIYIYRVTGASYSYQSRFVVIR